MTLEEYIHDMSLQNGTSRIHYLFDRNKFLLQTPELLEIYKPHHLFHYESNPIYEPGMTFALGPTGTGINFHYHKDGWNEVLYGRKRWFMYPPEIGKETNNSIESSIM